MCRILRKSIIISILLLIVATAFSQKKKPQNDVIYDKKPLHFGFTLGLNVMDFTLHPAASAMMPDSLHPNITVIHPGFNINVVSSLKLTEHINLRFLPGISFGQRSIYYYMNDSLVSTSQNVESSFLEFPVIFKYKSVRVNNWRPYLIGGINYRLDLAAKKEYDDEKDIYLRLKRSDIYVEAGIGIDFFLRFFKFSTEIKFSAGMMDMLVHTPSSRFPEYVTSIDKLKSRMWVLSFHFE